MPARNTVLGQKIHPPIIEAARTLRANSTPEEQTLWECLRNRRLNGWKFRRQQIIRNFIVDFYCHQTSLVIELDGEYHNDPDQQEYDAERDKILMEHGLQLMRIPNVRVRDELELVLAEIKKACESGASRQGDQ